MAKIFSPKNASILNCINRHVFYQDQAEEDERTLAAGEIKRLEVEKQISFNMTLTQRSAILDFIMKQFSKLQHYYFPKTKQRGKN